MTEVLCKCYYKKDVRVLGYLKSTVTLKTLKKRLKKEFKMALELKYQDKEGDNVVIRKPSHLREAVKTCLENDGVLRLHLFPPENGLSQIETVVLESLVAAVVVIDKRGELLNLFLLMQTFPAFTRQNTRFHARG